MTREELFEKKLDTIDLGAPLPSDEEGRQLYYIKKSRNEVKRRQGELGRPLTANVITFGCQMNARDSEKLLGILDEAGFARTDSEAADFVIFNTCTVRDNADQRLFGRLGRISHNKKSNPAMKVAVCGCMMQEAENVAKIKKSYPFVDLVFGTHNLFRFPEYLYETLAGRDRVVSIWDSTDRTLEALPVDRKYSYKSGVNISYGCNNYCTYCIVPYVRGRERSRSPEEVLDEVRLLASEGVVEVMLLGQNVNSYGHDFADPYPFSRLLKQVSEVDGIERVRFMTPHPKDLSEDLIQVIKDNPKIARHIHLPLQSGSTRILRKMNRHYTKESYIALAQHIREQIPDAAITTDIIVGFPGETKEDVDDTIDVIEQVHFNNAYTFIYSKRRGTPAAKMEDPISESEKKEQFGRVLRTVQRCARENAKTMEGQVQKALAEEVNTQDSSLITCRLSNNMIVHVPGDASMIGHFYSVRLDECKGFYYFGSVVKDGAGNA